MDWERRDFISAVALAVSVLALGGTVASTFYNAKQFQLNETRDRREIAGSHPIIEVTLTKHREPLLWQLEIKVTNRSGAELVFDGVDLSPSTDATFAYKYGSKFEDGGHEAPNGPLWYSVEGKSANIRSGYIRQNVSAPPEGQKGTIVFAFHFADNEDEQFVHRSSFSFY